MADGILGAVQSLLGRGFRSSQDEKRLGRLALQQQLDAVDRQVFLTEQLGGLLSGQPVPGAPGAPGALAPQPVAGLLAPGAPEPLGFAPGPSPQPAGVPGAPVVPGAPAVIGAPGEGLLSEQAPAVQVAGAPGSPGAQAPDQRQLLGILGQLAPQQFAAQAAQTVFPQQGRFDAKVNSLQQRLGRPLSEQEHLNLAGAASPDNAFEAIRAQLDILRLTQQIQGTADTQQIAAGEKELEDATVESALHSSLNGLAEMIGINDRRAAGGVLAQPGVFAGEKQFIAQASGTIAGLLGEDEAAQQLGQVSTDNERYDVLADQLAITRLETGSFNANTDSRFRAWQSTKPNSGLGAQTNSKVLADTLESTLSLAKARGIEIPDQERFEALIESARAAGNPDAGGGPAPPSGSRRE